MVIGVEHQASAGDQGQKGSEQGHDAHFHGFRVGSTQVVVRLPEGKHAAFDETLRLEVAPGRAHWFDADTGARVEL